MAAIPASQPASQPASHPAIARGFASPSSDCDGTALAATRRRNSSSNSSRLVGSSRSNIATASFLASPSTSFSGDPPRLELRDLRLDSRRLLTSRFGFLPFANCDFLFALQAAVSSSFFGTLDRPSQAGQLDRVHLAELPSGAPQASIGAAHLLPWRVGGRTQLQ